MRLTTRRCGDKAPVKEKGCLKFLYVALARPSQHSLGQTIRTVLVLLDILLLSNWFSSGIGGKAVPVGSLAYDPRAGISQF